MQAKYDTIGINYNLTRKADKFLTDQLLHFLEPDEDGIYLDIGCGTGNYTNELQKKGFQFIGIDPSIEMLKKAKSKNKQIDWRIGTATKTGLSKKSIDGIIGSLTIHHWIDLNNAFSELYRILKTDGKIVIFTSTPKQMKGYWLNHYFSKMLNDSIVQMPSFNTVITAMESSGIEIIGTKKFSIKHDLQDKFLYCGKHNPELYFDDNIRRGISSFSSLANRKEVEKGLKYLRKDIENGKIKEIIKSYENNMGDYLFIIGKKPTSFEA